MEAEKGTVLDQPVPEYIQIGAAWVRRDEVQAWRFYSGTMDIWFRHREDAVTISCDPVQAKAFELAFKNK